MPIVNVPPNPPTQPELPQQINAKLADADQRNALVDAKITPYAALLTHIEGSNWYVDYYSQVLGGDDEVMAYQPGQLAIYQQYLLIQGYELKLQGSLSTSDDSTTSVMTLTGTATLYPYLKPNVGDAFIADIGDGLAGQFTVDSVTKKTILKETCFEINFTLVRYATDDLIAAINQKVVKRTHFKRDYLVYGQNPIITTETLQAADKMALLEREFTTYWLSQYYSVEYRTLLVPGQTRGTYDPFVMKAMMSITDASAFPLLKKVRALNCDGLDRMRRTDLYTALLSLDRVRLQECFQSAFLAPVTVFSGHPYFDGVRYSGLGYVVVPADNGSPVDTDYVSQPLLTGMPYETTPGVNITTLSADFTAKLLARLQGGDEPLIAGSPYLSTSIPVIHPIQDLNAYVLTSAFYNDSATGKSKLEILVDDYLANNAVNKTVLYTFFDCAKSWGRLEQFYYLPILLMILKVGQRML